jgi:hypothetical protein
MNVGIVELHSLYGFAEKNNEVPHRTKDKQLYRQYRSLVINSLDESKVQKNLGGTLGL